MGAMVLHLRGLIFCSKGWLRGFWQEFDMLIISLGLFTGVTLIACLAVALQ
jgi:hypothetical protein